MTATLLLLVLVAQPDERGTEPSSILLLPTMRGGLLARDIAVRIDRQLQDGIARDASVRALPLEVARGCVAFVAELGAEAEVCRADVECLAKTAIACGARMLIAPRADWHAEGAALELVLVDAERAVVTKRSTELLRSVAGDADPAVAGALRRLLAPERFDAALRFTVEPTGARVRLDERELGPSPLAAETGLQEGRHALLIELEGHTTWRGDIELAPAEVKDVIVSLERDAGAALEQPINKDKVVSAPITPSLVRTSAATPSIAAPNSTASSTSWVLASAGGLASLVGAGGLAYGASTWFARQADLDDLARTESRFKDGTAVAADLRDARASHDSFARTDASFAVGLVVSALGVAAAAAGVGTLTWALVAPAENP